MYTLANTLTILRNGQLSGKAEVFIPASKLSRAVLSVIKSAGYIDDFETVIVDKHPQIRICLRYYEGRPVMELIRCVSKPSLRRYVGAREIPSVLGGLGLAVISTSQGVLAGGEARKRGLGGEVLAFIG